MKKSIIESFDTDKEDSAKKSQDTNETVEKDTNPEGAEQAQEVPKDTDKPDESPASATGEGTETTDSQSSEGQETTITTQDEVKSTSAADDAKPTTIKKQKDVNNPTGLDEDMPISPKPFEDDGKVKDISSQGNSEITNIVSAIQKGNEATIAAMAKSNADTIATFMSAIGNLLPKQSSSQDTTDKADDPVDPAKNNSASDSTEPATPKQDTPVQQEESKDLPNEDDKKENSSELSEKGEKEIPDTVEHVDDDHDVYVNADGKEPAAKKDDVGKDTTFDDSKAAKAGTDSKDTSGQSVEKDDSSKEEESMADLFIRARGNLSNYTSEYQQQHQIGNMTQEAYTKARNTVYNLMDGANINNFTREDLSKIANSKGAHEV